jgi:hypothetical protein
VILDTDKLEAIFTPLKEGKEKLSAGVNIYGSSDILVGNRVKI